MFLSGTLDKITFSKLKLTFCCLDVHLNLWNPFFLNKFLQNSCFCFCLFSFFKVLASAETRENLNRLNLRSIPSNLIKNKGLSILRPHGFPFSGTLVIWIFSHIFSLETTFWLMLWPSDVEWILTHNNTLLCGNFSGNHHYAFILILWVWKWLQQNMNHLVTDF